MRNDSLENVAGDNIRNLPIPRVTS